MGKRGKSYIAAMEKVDRQQHYSLDEAMELVKETAYQKKTDPSIDVAINLGVDPRHADQMVRGAVVLPHGVGKTVRVLVFAEGDKANEAREAGADYVGAKDLADKIKEGWLDFDKAVATPNMMRYVGPIGRILGPRGLMPNPKVGTVTMDVTKAVSDLKAGRVEFRVDKAGIIHCPIGRRSFDAEKLKENLMALVEVLKRAKPASAKGRYFQSITVSGTMGPGIKIDTEAATEALKA
jgi:large subunit ribosomal protein L1